MTQYLGINLLFLSSLSLSHCYRHTFTTMNTLFFSLLSGPFFCLHLYFSFIYLFLFYFSASLSLSIGQLDSLIAQGFGVIFLWLTLLTPPTLQTHTYIHAYRQAYVHVLFIARPPKIETRIQVFGDPTATFLVKHYICTNPHLLFSSQNFRSSDL